MDRVSIRQARIEGTNMNHCDDCAPEFGCWSDSLIACRKRPATAAENEIARLRAENAKLRESIAAIHAAREAQDGTCETELATDDAIAAALKL